MTFASRRDDLIVSIYDTVAEQNGLAAIPLLLEKEFRGDNGLISLTEGTQVREAYVSNLSADVLGLYEHYYCHIDPWLATARSKLPLGRASRSSDLVPELQFTQSEFYTDFAKVHGTVQAIGGHIMADSVTLCSLAVHRDKGAKRFSRADVRRLETLLVHTKQALKLRTHFGARATDQHGLAALAALTIGAIITDATGGIQFVNEAAEKLATTGNGMTLGRAGQRFGFLHADENRQLSRLMIGAAEGGPGGGMLIRSESEERIYVIVAPLRTRYLDRPGRVLIALRPVDAPAHYDSRMLARLFGLTSSEARLALSLASGASLADIAKQTEISANTLRSQLSQIFRKTETATQRDLIRVLSQIPPLKS